MIFALKITLSSPSAVEFSPPVGLVDPHAPPAAALTAPRSMRKKIPNSAHTIDTMKSLRLLSSASAPPWKS